MRDGRCFGNMHGPEAGIVCLLSPAQYSLCVYISYVKGIYNIQSSRAAKLQYINIFASNTFRIYAKVEKFYYFSFTTSIEINVL